MNGAATSAHLYPGSLLSQPVSRLPRARQLLLVPRAVPLSSAQLAPQLGRLLVQLSRGEACVFNLQVELRHLGLQGADRALLGSSAALQLLHAEHELAVRILECLEKGGELVDSTETFSLSASLISLSSLTAVS